MIAARCRRSCLRMCTEYNVRGGGCFLFQENEIRDWRASAGVCAILRATRNFSGSTTTILLLSRERERERGFIRFSTYASGVVAESTRLYHDALNRDDEGWTFTKTRGEKIGEIDFVFDQEIMGF